MSSEIDTMLGDLGFWGLGEFQVPFLRGGFVLSGEEARRPQDTVRPKAVISLMGNMVWRAAASIASFQVLTVSSGRDSEKKALLWQKPLLFPAIAVLSMMCFQLRGCLQNPSHPAGTSVF